MSKNKRIMDRVTVQIKNGPLVVLDIVPCPSNNSSICLAKAMEYYATLYPDDYIDCICGA